MINIMKYRYLLIMKKNVISEIHDMKKKMGLVNEMNFDDIDNESVESRIKKDLHTSVIEFIIPILRESATSLLKELLPIAMEVVSSLLTSDKSGDEKRKIAVDKIKDAAVKEGINASNRTVNLAIELALAKLTDK